MSCTREDATMRKPPSTPVRLDKSLTCALERQLPPSAKRRIRSFTRSGSQADIQTGSLFGTRAGVTAECDPLLRRMQLSLPSSPVLSQTTSCMDPTAPYSGRPSLWTMPFSGHRISFSTSGPSIVWFFVWLPLCATKGTYQNTYLLNLKLTLCPKAVHETIGGTSGESYVMSCQGNELGFGLRCGECH